MTWAQLARLASISLLAAGCGQQVADVDADMYAGKISGDWAGEPALRIAYGRHWTMAGDTAADASGAFRVPSSARAVVAYIDANHNGRFDRFAEPSGACRLTGQDWSCWIKRRRTTLHRSISRRAAEHSDKTHVFWEDFTLDGSRSTGSQLCVEHRCTSLEAPPFLLHSDAKVQVFSICGEMGFAPVDAEVRGLTHKLAVPLARPADLTAAAAVEATPDPRHVGGASAGLRLRIAAPAVDRVLVWAGDVDARSGESPRVYWTSEDRGFEIDDAPGGMTVWLPAAAVESCRRDPACEIVVQLIKYWSPPGAPVVGSTEFRSAVAFRGVP